MNSPFERVRLIAAAACAGAGLMLTAHTFANNESSNRLLCDSGLCAGQWTPAPCYASLGNRACCCDVNWNTPGQDPEWKCLCVNESECKKRDLNGCQY